MPEEAQPKPTEEELPPELELRLPYPTAAIMRILKANMDSEKMVKKEVKIALNKWLGEVTAQVAREVNKFPYVMLHMHELQKAIEPYENLEKFQEEKALILSHLEAIRKDVERLEKDLGKIEVSAMQL